MTNNDYGFTDEVFCVICNTRPAQFPAATLCATCRRLPHARVFHTTTATLGAEAQPPPLHRRQDPSSSWRVETMVYIPARPSSSRHGLPFEEPARVLLLWSCEVICPEPSIPR